MEGGSEQTSSPPQTNWQDVRHPVDDFFGTPLVPQLVKPHLAWTKHIQEQRTAQYKDVIEGARSTSLVHTTQVTAATSLPAIDATDLQTAFNPRTATPSSPWVGDSPHRQR